jgi:hypothetical protein
MPGAGARTDTDTDTDTSNAVLTAIGVAAVRAPCPPGRAAAGPADEELFEPELVVRGSTARSAT